MESGVTAVFDMSKIQFWKQFTTIKSAVSYSFALYSICQRYNFESNLQQSMWFCTLKFAVFDMSKIQFWKQFTTCVLWNILVFLLYSICQRYNFESNLQLNSIRSRSTKSCIRYVKDTILEANSQHVYMHVCILEWNIPFYLKTNRF